MSLFEKLKDTSLKSLKFGQTGGTGDTKPYIVTDINTVDRGFNNFRMTRFDDGFIRGGGVGSLNAGITDTLRIGKFLTDFPKGPLFITKQVGLQLSNPRLETKQLPTNKTGTSFIGKIGATVLNLANKINNLVGGPTRIYNLGINTLAQVPVNALGGHIVRHGFLPVQNEIQKYFSVITENNNNGNNRLENLYNTLLSGTDTRVNFFKNNRYSDLSKTIIDSYISGPGSFYGIGSTTIRRTTYTADKDKIRKSLNINSDKSRAIDSDIKLYVSKEDSIFKQYNYRFSQDQRLDSQNEWKGAYSQSLEQSLQISSNKSRNGFYILPDTEPTSSFTKRLKYDKSFNPINTFLNLDPTGKNEQNRYDIPESTPLDHITSITASYDVVSEGVSSRVEGILVFEEDVQKTTNNFLPKTSNKTYNDLITNKINQTDFRVPTTYNVYPGIVNKEFKDIDGIINRNPTEFSNNYLDYNYNLINLGDVYDRNDADILKVTFTQLDPFSGTALNILPFSAYISGYSETYNSNWDDIKYNGRSEFLYAFNSYRKTATFKLMIPIFQPDELKVKHERLKLLQSGLAGKYSGNRLGGILTRINLGYYLYGAACIINNLTVSIPDDASWDWGVDGNSNLAYAMLLEANFQITIVDDSVVGFVEKKEEEKKENKPKPNPLPIPKPVVPKVVPVEIKRPKVTVAPPPPKPREIPIDSTRVVKPQRLKGKGEVKKPTKPVKYGGGDFGGGGAGGDF
jgi:hypothetical protein